MQHVVDDILPGVSSPYHGGRNLDLNALDAFLSPFVDTYEKYWIVRALSNDAAVDIEPTEPPDSKGPAQNLTKRATSPTGLRSLDDAGAVGVLTKEGDRSGLLGMLIQNNYVFPNSSISYCPFFEDIPTVEDAQQAIRDGLTELNYHTTKEIVKSDLLFQLPDAVFDIQELDITNRTLKYTFMYNQDPVYMRILKMTPEDKKKLSKAQPMANLNSAFIASLLGRTFSARIEEFPYEEQPFTVVLSDLVGVALIPFSLLFMIPLYMHTVVREKEAGLREFMKMMRVSQLSYLVYNYLFNFVLYNLVAATLIATEVIYEVRVFTQSNPFLVVCVLELWAVVQIPLAFLLSVVFQSSTVSSLFGYLIVVMGVIISEILNQFIFPAPSTLPIIFYAWPPFIFQRILYVLIDHCSDLHCVTWEAFSIMMWNMFGEQEEVGFLIFALIAYALALPPLVYVFDLMFPGKYGVPLRPFHALYDRYLKRHSLISRATQRGDDHSGWNRALDPEGHDVAVEMDLLSQPEHEMHGQDEGVARETQRVMHCDCVLEQPIVARQLTKAFGGRQRAPGEELIAVDHLSFAVGENEVFGLLGPNGAGYGERLQDSDSSKSPVPMHP
eukprot:TRINITY_DN3974_c2_g1_i3.p1 TRINITY_DN3974_c2_g1~~TRINITY_DN3974_c2_g1_i3.p1  ORF type:complete len:680 (-),score=110.23 TRINITY_DN3974_c2_g1_i3:1502-3334(-)